MSESTVNIAIIGDIHLHFSEEDVAYFNVSNYDLLLFVGDLSNYSPRKGYRLARTVARLEKPALFIPGNHDTVNLLQLFAEIKGNRPLIKLFSVGQERRDKQLRCSLGKVVCGGYSLHTSTLNGRSFNVVTGRPYSMGGPSLGFRPFLRRRYGVDSMEASSQLLMQQVDKATTGELIFLAHNGPYGLGEGRADIWGCDFLEEKSDYGDRDLAMAIEYARSRNKRVLAVIAGHMHHRLKGGGDRQWCLERDGITYINAARVPRTFRQAGEDVRYHVSLTINGSQISVRQRLV